MTGNEVLLLRTPYVMVLHTGFSFDIIKCIQLSVMMNCCPQQAFYYGLMVMQQNLQLLNILRF